MQNSLTLTLPVTDSKKVEIFSSNPKNVYLPKRSIENKIHAIPGTVNHINIHTKTFSSEMKRVVVNALGKFALHFNSVIDFDSGKLIYSWLLILQS